MPTTIKKEYKMASGETLEEIKNSVIKYKDSNIEFDDNTRLKTNNMTLRKDGKDITFQLGRYNFYNTEGNLDNYRAAYAKLKAGETAKYNILAIGDSIMNGLGTTTPTEDSAVSLFRDNLHNTFADTGLGAVSAQHVSDGDFFTYSSGDWVNNYTAAVLGSPIFGAAGAPFYTTVSEASVSFSVNGTGVGVLLAGGGSFYTLGTASIQVGTDPTVSVDCSSSTATVFAQEITGVTQSDYTVTVTADLDAGENLVFCGFYPIKGTSGFTVHNMSVNGTTATLWNNIYSTGATLDVFQPKLTLIGLGGNSLSNGVAVATYKSDLEGLVASAKAYGDVVLIAEGIFTSSADLSSAVATREDYRDAMREVALNKGCVFIDYVERWNNDGDNMDTLGLLADTVHLNDYGSADLAEFLINNIK